MIKTFTIAPVRKTLVVNATQAHAFDVFTNRLDSWWPKGHSIGALPVKQSFIEPRKGGRWYTTHDDGSECVVGHMKVWEPPHRIVFSWEISADWKPDPTVASEVEIIFVAQDARTTRVELEHRNFEALGEKGGEKMRGGVEGGWSGLLEIFRKQAEV
ncbi:MAG: SRPBCC family protein [Rhizomicrobium sp.]